jgi:hypothetical protein
MAISSVLQLSIILQNNEGSNVAHAFVWQKYVLTLKLQINLLFLKKYFKIKFKYLSV